MERGTTGQVMHAPRDLHRATRQGEHGSAAAPISVARLVGAIFGNQRLCSLCLSKGPLFAARLPSIERFLVQWCTYLPVLWRAFAGHQRWQVWPLSRTLGACLPRIQAPAIVCVESRTLVPGKTVTRVLRVPGAVCHIPPPSTALSCLRHVVRQLTSCLAE